MNNKDIYKIWAPSKKKWVDWVRPVPFIAIKNNNIKFQPSNVLFPGLKINDAITTAVIIDLPGVESVEAGILLAKQYGYRPIPIYNGVIEQEGARATTNNTSISNALIWGAHMLSEMNLDDNAPPAFLTDKNRLQRYQIDSSIFDNSWDVYHQDLPSEDYLIKSGITKIIVISDGLSKDLKKIFSEYSKKKIQIFLTDGYKEEVKCIKK